MTTSPRKRGNAEEVSDTERANLPAPEETETVAEVAKIEPPQPEPKADLSSNDRCSDRFSTDFYKQAGIGICSKCGEKRRTNDLGVFCPIKSDHCPIK